MKKTLFRILVGLGLLPSAWSATAQANSSTLQTSWAVLLSTPAPAAPTSFYIDPLWRGAATGAATSPWTNMNNPGKTVWPTINAALQTNDVTLYFTPFDHTGTNQTIVTNWFVQCARSDGTNSSPHTLTLDGYSLYNTSETVPRWVPNPNPNIANAMTNQQVFCILGNSNCVSPASSLSSIGWGRGSLYKKQSRITVQGFEATGYAARVSFAGDSNLWQYLYVHDTAYIGAAITILYTFPDNGVSNLNQQLMAPSTNMTLNSCYITRTFGPAIYLGSIDPDIPTNIQAAAGNQHANVEICSNIIISAGSTGGGGASISAKDGIINYWVHDNVVANMTNGDWAISTPQTIVNTDQNAVIERNVIYGSHAGANGLGTAIYGVTTTNMFGINGLMVRNNLIYNNGYGIRICGSTTGGIVTNAYIYNNTIYGCDNPGLILQHVSGLVSMNNIVVTNDSVNAYQYQGLWSANPGGFLISDYNAYSISPSINSSEGSHSVYLTGSQIASVFVNPQAANFGLLPSSPVIGAATNLMPVVTGDISGLNRASVGNWNMGALGVGTPLPPTNLRIVSFSL